MAGRNAIAGRNVGRKALAAAAAALVFAAGSLGGLAVPPAAEAASTYVALQNNHVKVKVPKSWKNTIKLGVYTSGSGKGYQADFRVEQKNSTYLAFSIVGKDKKNYGSAVSSKTTAKAGSSQLSWTLKNKTGNSATLTFRNVYEDAWWAAHRGGFSTVEKSTWNRLIKTYSGGKASYAKVKKWSEAKATSEGAKAIRSYAKKHIVKGIALR